MKVCGEGGWIGAHVAVNKGEKLIRAILSIAIVLLAARLLLMAR